MKIKYILTAIALTLALIYFYKEKDRHMTLAKNSYETGCYHLAQRVCLGFKREKEINECYQFAYVECPIMSKKFEDWLRGK